MAKRYKKAPKHKDPFPLCYRQKKAIEHSYSCFVCRIVSHSVLRCIGFIKPDTHSPDYEVQIEYRPKSSPTVRILSPKIEMSSNIHVYRDGSLCLYYPPDEKWKETDLISKKIIPWVAEWLLYYEMFLLTGKWEGPEAPHLPV